MLNAFKGLSQYGHLISSDLPFAVTSLLIARSSPAGAVQNTARLREGSFECPGRRAEFNSDAFGDANEFQYIIILSRANEQVWNRSQQASKARAALTLSLRLTFTIEAVFT